MTTTRDRLTILRNEALLLQAKQARYTSGADIHELNCLIGLCRDVAALMERKLAKGSLTGDDERRIGLVEEQVRAYKRGGLNEVRRVRRTQRWT